MGWRSIARARYMHTPRPLGPLSARFLLGPGPLIGPLATCTALARRTDPTQNPYWAYTEPESGPTGHYFMPARGPVWCLTNTRVVACSKPAQRSLFARFEVAQGPLKNTRICHHISARLEFTPGPLYAHSVPTVATQGPLSACSRVAQWPAHNMRWAGSQIRAHTEPAMGHYTTHNGPARSLLCACQDQVPDLEASR